jgi:FecR protein
MNRIFKTKSRRSLTLILAIILTSIGINQAAYAEVINQSHWLVKSGDSVYGIARKVFPDSSKLQAKFRQELIKNNPDVFQKGASQMSVGVKLVMPAFAIKKSKPTAVKATKPVEKKKIEKAPKREMLAKKTAPKPTTDIIGKVVINIGDLKAENSGNTRALKRNSKIFKGDTLKTLTRTHTQIRLKDGALVSLRPSTILKISEYNYNGQEDGSERSVFELVKGGFRTITGAIGHRNKQNYKVKTSFATIGIRGTHYGVMLCSSGSCSNENTELKDGLYGGVVDGSVIASNDSGNFKFNNDQYFHIANTNLPAVEILVPPPIFHGNTLKPDLQKQSKDKGHKPRHNLKKIMAGHKPPPIFGGSNDSEGPRPPLPTDDQNTPVLNIPKPRTAPAGSGLLIAFNNLDASGNTGVTAPILVSANNNNAIFLEDPVINGNVIGNLPFGVHEESSGKIHDAAIRRPDGTGAAIVPSSIDGNALGVNWGRWQGNFIVLENKVEQNHRNNLHYMYSPNTIDVTDPNVMAFLGGIYSINQSYSSVGGTNPTDHQGNIGASLASINMGVDFVNKEIDTYSIFATVNGKTYQAALDSAINPTVKFSDLHKDFALKDISAGCISGQCVGQASVIFVGPQAEGAMTSYIVGEPDGTASISGTNLLTIGGM